MKIRAYIVASDGGFAPNPFCGWCTLACCKPAIRRKAQAGDWVVGLSRGGERLIYAMQVKESLTFADYWRDKRFRERRPSFAADATRKQRAGDNCYEPLGEDQHRQHPCWHSADPWKDVADPKSQKRDLGGRYVLVGRRFCYYGAAAPPIPAYVQFRRPARYNRVNFTEAEKASLIAWLETLPQGVHARPSRWPADESSWREAARCG